MLKICWRSSSSKKSVDVNIVSVTVTTASLLSINNALIEQTSPTRADNVVMQSVANAHVRTELCCKISEYWTGYYISPFLSR